MTKLKSLMAAAALAVGALSAPAAHAAYALTLQNVTFTINQVDSASFTLRVQNLLNGPDVPVTGGDWANATHYGALAFKGIGSGFTTWSIVPSGTPGTGGINASGCSGQGAGFYCFAFADGTRPISQDDTFTISVTGASLSLDPNSITLRGQFTLQNGSKVGALLSNEVPSTSSGSSGSSNTSGQMPEPGTSSLALLGLAMVGSAFALRRRQQQKGL